ncbi:MULTISPECIES: peptidoglycan-binding domain-containing protein [Spirulina sp. CCY15215]|uniref:peptidoglycan-binding domain-containing protein n=1 Tax=Spirulina sp. CCY15215 TaxID=2767591 RepID=UPI00194E1389|nr:peptidoglycan-binding domain-containing protein [Spirulina major]
MNNTLTKITQGLIIVGLILFSTSAKAKSESVYSRCQSNPNTYCLRSGNRGELVHELIENLTCLGYYFRSNDGNFGQITERSVRNFQRDYSLTIDGIAGSRTRNLLSQQCSATKIIKVDEFTFEETDGSTGCSLYLNRKNANNSSYIFLYLLGSDYGEMKLDRRIQRVNFISENNNGWSFNTRDRQTKILINIQKSVINTEHFDGSNVEGQMRIQRNGQELIIPFKGYSGC